MQLTLGLVTKLVGGTLIGGSPDKVLSDVVVDSRGTLPRDSIFVALSGQRFDGHDFIPQAFERGAIAALVSHIPDGIRHQNLALVHVDDTLQALHRLARGWRELFDIPVVAVTGSNGKTIVKDMLAAIMGQEHTVYRSPGSFNSQVGVPLSLLGIRQAHDLAIIEVGISRVGEMSRLQQIVQPTMGIITNIGLAHAAGLPSLEITAAEKLRLFEDFTDNDENILIYPGDDDILSSMTLPGRTIAFHVKQEAEFFCDTGKDVMDYCLLENIEHHGESTAFMATLPGGESAHFQLNIPGKHNIYNAAAALSAASSLGASVDAMHEGLASFELSSLRLEMHTTQTGITLINDAYNSDPLSAREAINVLRHYAGGQRSVAIFGDMLDLGKLSHKAHTDLGEFIARVGVDYFISVGPSAQLIGESAKQHGMSADNIRFAKDLDELHELLERLLTNGDVVLFKASRNIGLERAAQRLLESVASARLTIDLDAISDNFHAIKAAVNTGVMAVVKSFGYGNDATKISQALVQQGVDALAVAYPDEAIPLRQKGLSVPILVTNVLSAEADKIVKYDLTALVYTHDVARAIEQQARRRDKLVDIHIEINTGMNRVGLKAGEVVEFARKLTKYPHLVLKGLMTHFAAADDPLEDEFTRRQIRITKKIRDQLENDGHRLEVVHLANTAGLWRFPDARADMVRVGLGLYGLHPSDAVAQRAYHTRPALAFTTRVIHLQSIEPGESVGYGRTWKAARPSKIATIAAGYNDGFPRFLSNRGEVLIQGKRCPIVGNICMDVAMIDVTDLESVRGGDEVVLLGQQHGNSINVDEWARIGNTISYEILCNISPRVRRIFLKT